MAAMQRAEEEVVESSTEDGSSLPSQKALLLQVRDKGDELLPRRPELQQWRNRQLQRLAEELKAEWQETQLQQIKDLERLYLARLLGGVADQAVGSQAVLDELISGEMPKAPRPRDKHKGREKKSRREEPPRQPAWYPKSRKKTAGSERRRPARSPGLNPPEKGKGKRAPSSKSSSSCRSVNSRVSRGRDFARLCPLLTPVEEIEEPELEEAWRGRRQGGPGTPVSVQGLKPSSRDHSPEDKLSDLEQSWLGSTAYKRGDLSPGSSLKGSEKNRWQRELESAFEELFNTNRKLKKQLSSHLEQRPRGDPGPGEEQGLAELRHHTGRAYGGLPRRRGEEEDEASETSSTTTTLRQLLSRAENLKYLQMAKPELKESPMAFAGTRVPKSEEGAPSRNASPTGTALGEHHPALQEEEEEEEEGPASWAALRQKQKGEMEQRRKTAFLGQTEHPDMSLEIHYKAELEEERRERRRTRLALLKAYSTGAPSMGRGAEFRSPSVSGTSLLDEDRHNQMVHDLQQQISEQNKLHQQFLDKARKRLQDFQKTC
ncbi:LOW QUALITY PROTEIN: protein DDC8 homolog [Perognathus longimembris pacificus]|uniref:LOW QUALITY PROTEIN: protein DDC8 homolog n=1 Tax=Perognathus longimembris pacificus TaxID=214514 RepID=UPI002019CE4D|nr:LOW QUALITY PROTEIN: protein DDC8 homolog [Perognathus longimembris pacificus]